MEDLTGDKVHFELTLSVMKPVSNVIDLGTSYKLCIDISRNRDLVGIA